MNLHAVALTLGLFGGLSVLLAYSRTLAMRRGAAVGHLLMAVALGSAAVVLWQTAVHLESYERLADDRPVADIDFEQLASDRFRATVTSLPSGRMQQFELTGETWQLQARLLEWKGWAHSIGMAPRYRLERLSTHDSAAPGHDREASAAYEFAEGRGLDVWSLARAGGRWARIIVPGYGSGDFLPMAKDASFRVRMSQRGLLVRPNNEAAERALETVVAR
jgi:hypothetical protein